MKKRITLIITLLVLMFAGNAQNPIIDSLKYQLNISSEDTSRVSIIDKLCNHYKFRRPDSAIYYGNKGLELTRKINSPQKEVSIMHNISLAYLTVGNDSRALQITLQGIKIAEKNSLMYGKGRLLLDLAKINSNSENYLQALKIYKESKLLFDKAGVATFSTVADCSIARTLSMMNHLDSALYYAQLANEKAEQINIDWVTGTVQLAFGEIYSKNGNWNSALSFYLSCQPAGDDIPSIYLAIAKVYQKIDKPDSAIYFALRSLDIAQKNEQYSDIIHANNLLSELFENEDQKKALEYKKRAFTAKDVLDKMRKVTALEAFIDYDEQDRRKEIESAKKAYQNQVQRLWIFSITGALLSALLVAFILYRNDKNKQKANVLLKEQKEEVQNTLNQLNSTQSQLIQSEKMASLGELTAGIAHEIQNPLNFVNNFSEVNKELLTEMKDEIQKGNLDEANVLVNDVINNEEKIIHHGKRADAIVKGMLQHSRTSSGQKELTDISALCDEYLRLSYHGLRAKDKSFNADFKTELDPDLPMINVVPQDIGRVLLNLINNAFYAVDKKSKHPSPEASDVKVSEDKDYKPLVTVSTKKLSDKIEIKVKDNGPGIPEQVRDKIFQPFFTTKPTGSGTGLGLSLSYDIVKAHGGEIKVNTIENEGTAFIIQLPI